MPELHINDKITIPEEFIRVTYIRSSGPGGQNVNKVNTRAQLTFDLDRCEILAAPVRHRLKVLAGKRYTKSGSIQMESDRHRHQARNLQDVLCRLRHLINQALIPPKKRRPTKPTRTSIQKRLDRKKQHSQLKTQRGQTYP